MIANGESCPIQKRKNHLTGVAKQAFSRPRSEDENTPQQPEQHTDCEGLKNQVKSKRRGDRRKSRSQQDVVPTRFYAGLLSATAWTTCAGHNLLLVSCWLFLPAPALAASLGIASRCHWSPAQEHVCSWKPRPE